jgi:SEC-C motif domain protein
MYHEGEAPPDALALMRSRYTAYVKYLLDYIIKTTHPKHPHFRSDTAQWKKEMLASCKSIKLHDLKIVDFTDGGKEAWVSFIASYKENGLDYQLVEKSYFVKEKDLWLYRDASFTVESPNQ